MKYGIVKIFILMFLILFNGYGNLYAYNSETSPVSLSKHSAKISFSNFKTEDMISRSLLNFKQTSKEDNSIKLRATNNEVEEEEVVSSQKVIVSNNYFASFYNLLKANDVIDHIKKWITSNNLFYFFSESKRYIFFQVIRI